MTQSFGLGVFETVTAASLDEIERFYRERGSWAVHEVCTFAGVATLQLLCERGYKPTEISDVLYRHVEMPADNLGSGVTVRITGSEEAAVWTNVNTEGWAHELPELRAFMLEVGAISASRTDNCCFLAEIDGVPGAAGALCMHEGVALFCGASTIPEMRRRGLQNALLRARMRYAHEQGCDLAMMVAAPGSNSHRNAERAGFAIAYTRTKWQLS